MPYCFGLLDFQNHFSVCSHTNQSFSHFFRRDTIKYNCFVEVFSDQIYYFKFLHFAVSVCCVHMQCGQSCNFPFLEGNNAIMVMPNAARNIGMITFKLVSPHLQSALNSFQKQFSLYPTSNNEYDTTNANIKNTAIHITENTIKNVNMDIVIIYSLSNSFEILYKKFVSTSY